MAGIGWSLSAVASVPGAFSQSRFRSNSRHLAFAGMAFNAELFPVCVFLPDILEDWSRFVSLNVQSGSEIEARLATADQLGFVGAAHWFQTSGRIFLESVQFQSDAFDSVGGEVVGQ